jgi:hypothetical protein
LVGHTYPLSSSTSDTSRLRLLEYNKYQSQNALLQDNTCCERKSSPCTQVRLVPYPLTYRFSNIISASSTGGAQFYASQRIAECFQHCWLCFRWNALRLMSLVGPEPRAPQPSACQELIRYFQRSLRLI